MRGECGFVWPTAGPCIYSRKEHDDYQLGHDFEEKKLQQTEWEAIRDPVFDWAKDNPVLIRVEAVHRAVCPKGDRDPKEART